MSQSQKQTYFIRPFPLGWLYMNFCFSSFGPCLDPMVRHGWLFLLFIWFILDPLEVMCSLHLGHIQIIYFKDCLCIKILFRPFPIDMSSFFLLCIQTIFLPFALDIGGCYLLSIQTTFNKPSEPGFKVFSPLSLHHIQTFPGAGFQILLLCNMSSTFLKAIKWIIVKV